MADKIHNISEVSFSANCRAVGARKTVSVAVANVNLTTFLRKEGVHQRPTILDMEWQRAKYILCCNHIKYDPNFNNDTVVRARLIAGTAFTKVADHAFRMRRLANRMERMIS